MEAQDGTTPSAYGGRGYQILITIWTLTGTGTLLLLLWTYARFAIKPSGGWALIWASVYWFLCTVTSIVSTLSVVYGVGNHLSIIEKSGQLHNTLLYIWLSCFFFFLNIPVGKVAVSAMLVAFMGKTHLIWRGTMIVIAVANLVFAIPGLVLTLVHCKPVGAIFDPLLQKSHCNLEPMFDYWYFMGALWCISDILQAVTAILLVWPLQMNRTLKLALSSLMCFGFVAAACSIVRSVLNRDIEDPDAPYAITDLFVWAKAEEWAVMIVPAVPHAYPTVKLIWQKATGRPSTDHAQSYPLPVSVSSAFRVTKEDRLRYNRSDGLDHPDASGDNLVPPAFELSGPPSRTSRPSEGSGSQEKGRGMV